jgi:hypothetical protein
MKPPTTARYGPKAAECLATRCAILYQNALQHLDCRYSLASLAESYQSTTT